MSDRRRIASMLTAAAILGGVAVAGYWAGTNVVAPPALPVAEHATQTYTAEVGSVGRSDRLPVSVVWPTARTLFAASDGVVTSIPYPPGAQLAAGDVIATIDLHPVVVAAGAVPMFRTLRKGDEGPDVEQLQGLLRALGFLAGPADGRFGEATVDATKRWQRSVGSVATGVVDPGALLFVGQVPARLVVVPGVGARVGAGSELVQVLADRPTFTATVSPSTRAELQTGMAIVIEAPGGDAWRGSLGTFEVSDDGRYRATITGTLCGRRCDSLPVAGETALTGSVEIIPTTSGVVVPVSALVQQPSGRPAVTLSDGTTRPVRVLAEADGFAVVDGLPAGTVILLPSPPAP